ncbi:MAG TPA: hypothetical protein VF317_10570 [Dermatophilaceae bacterium]|jgi:hypothetical protein
MNSLIAQVDTELARCEAIIERRLKTFIEVGEALATIRNKGLLLQDQKPFEDYCQDRWGGLLIYALGRSWMPLRWLPPCRSEQLFRSRKATSTT